MFACAVTAASVLAYVLSPWLDYSWYKLFTRGVLVCVALGLWWLWRQLHLSPGSVGWQPGPPGACWILRTYGVGLLCLEPPATVFVVTGYRVVDPEVQLLSFEWLLFLLQAMVGGLLVGLLEESLFRGVMWAWLCRNVPTLVTVLVTAFLYSSVHFVGVEDESLVQESNHVLAGWLVFFQAFQQFNQPLAIADAWVCLFLLGCLFGYVRHIWGLWACVVLHAAFVFGLRTFKELTVRDVVNPYAHWVGGYDHFTGELVSVWVVVLGIGLFAWRRVARHTPP